MVKIVVRMTKNITPKTVVFGTFAFGQFPKTPADRR